MRSPGVVRAVDVSVVLLLAVSGQVSVLGAPAADLDGGRALHAVLLALVTLPLLVRHRFPSAVLVLVTVAAALQYELGAGVPQPWFAMLLALYAVAAGTERAVAAAGAALVGVMLLAVDVPRLRDGVPLDEVLPAWGVTAGVWAFGRWMRRRRRETGLLRDRAERAEAERSEQAALAVAEERARISRELHDLVAHAMGVVVIQAQAGQRVLDTDPATARKSLEAIEGTARQGLGELRRLLGLLSSRPDGSVSPQPGLRDLDRLADQVRSAGLQVRTEVVGDLAALPAGVDLAAYRIVQEALTNALKHASARAATVTVRRSGSVLDLEVVDDGSAGNSQPAAPGGHGLVGMRERAALYGGAVDAAHVPGGGFRVRARLDAGLDPA